MEPIVIRAIAGPGEMERAEGLAMTDPSFDVMDGAPYGDVVFRIGDCDLGMPDTCLGWFLWGIQDLGGDLSDGEEGLFYYLTSGDIRVTRRGTTISLAPEFGRGGDQGVEVEQALLSSQARKVLISFYKDAARNHTGLFRSRVFAEQYERVLAI